jgi:molecular chaperone DnaK
MNTLNAAWQSASQDMYNAQQGAPSGAEATTENNPGDNVTDVDFEEVKDEKK